MEKSSSHSFLEVIIMHTSIFRNCSSLNRHCLYSLLGKPLSPVSNFLLLFWKHWDFTLVPSSWEVRHSKLIECWVLILVFDLLVIVFTSKNVLAKSITKLTPLHFPMLMPAMFCPTLSSCWTRASTMPTAEEWLLKTINRTFFSSTSSFEFCLIPVTCEDFGEERIHLNNWCHQFTKAFRAKSWRRVSSMTEITRARFATSFSPTK